MLAAINDSGTATNRALNFAGWIAVGATAALAAWTLARLFWAMVGLRADAPGPIADPAQPSAARPDGPGVDLASLHLFGQAGLPERPVKAQAPETRLALRLLGTAAADDPAVGLAIIADDTGEQGFYRAGDALPGDAELEEIHPDRIVLTRQGRRETLRLVREEAAGNAGGGRSAARSPAARSGRSVAGPGAVDWQAARTRARLDPQQLMELGSRIRAMPVRENGEPIGVRLVASRDAALIRRLGLRSSDVIQSVNGIPLTDPSRQFELMRLLQDRSRFRVQLRRNGSPMTLDIDASRLRTGAD